MPNFFGRKNKVVFYSAKAVKITLSYTPTPFSWFIATGYGERPSLSAGSCKIAKVPSSHFAIPKGGCG